MNNKSTYYAIVNGIAITADTLLELRRQLKMFIEKGNLSWHNVEGLYRIKNGKIYLIGNR